MTRHFLFNFSRRSILLIALGLFLTTHLQAEGKIFGALSQEVSAIFDQVKPAVVRVRSVDVIEPLAGTGFFIDNNGTILTSSAIARDDYKLMVEYNGKDMEALVLGKDPRSGVALIRINAQNTPLLKFGDSDKLKIASELLSVAYPYNLPASPNLGIVAGFDVQYLNRFFATTHIRANLMVSPGQIGGPVLNANGHVVGMLVMTIEDNKGCYALPSNAAQKITQDILQYGEARHGWVGVGVVEDTRQDAKIVRVSNLFDHTPAAKSGIQPGDEVIQIGKKEIHQPSDILDAAFFSKIGEKIPVLVRRNGKEHTFHIEARERPEQSKPVQPIPPAFENPNLNDPIRVRGNSS